MRAVVQRVTSATVKVEGERVGAIRQGLLILIGIEHPDTVEDATALADKLAGLRTFEDENGKMNLDIAQVGGAFLVVSQFTLGASLARGRRPSFNAAAAPEKAEPLIKHFVERLRGRDFEVAEGRFGAHMEIGLVNDGPVTFILEAREGKIL